jgi:membrane protein implicated in regulation of membrane protease activity
MEIYLPYIWLAVIVLAAILEGVTAQMVSIWFVVGGLGALIASLLHVSPGAQLLIFAALTAVTLAATRPFVNKIMNFKKTDTNAGRYIGQMGAVTAEINNMLGTGQVNVRGSIWTARSEDGSVIRAGERVLVKSIEGVKLIVELQKENKEEKA